MVFHRENYDTQVSRKLKNYENWPNLMTEIRGLLAYILIQTHTHTNIYIYIYIYIYIQSVPKPISQTSPGYSPPLIKQKRSYQHGSKSEQVPRYPLLCRNPRNAVINKTHATVSTA